METLASLKNLGPTSAERLQATGIKTPAQLEQVGPVEAYKRVKEAYPGDTSLILLYALQGAIWGIHWNEVPTEVKARLREEAGETLVEPDRKGRL